MNAALGANAVGALAILGREALTPMLFDNTLAVTNLSNGRTHAIPVGIAPVAVAAHGRRAYVANWGGAAADAAEAFAPTGLGTSADRVRIDERGVAREGTVSIVDLARRTVIATIPVGRHPTALALDAGGERLYVANANDDSIAIVDTRARMLVETISVQPFSQRVDGVAPTALAIDTAKNRLYIACGGINAVAVYDLAAKRMAGLIPTGWYPISVSLDTERSRLAIGTLLGVGSGWQTSQDRRYVHANRGTLHVVAEPDDAQLASYSAAVAENNRLTLASAEPETPAGAVPPRALPRRAGEPSLIEHVVYIIKENRTYDQVFGDLDAGNGEPNFVMFGEDVTPNHRELARQFVLLDNFYATGGNSANGHQWVTQANETSYTLWPGYSGRSYPFDGSDPLAYAARGFIWDAALARGRTVSVFGEYAPRMSWDAAGRVDLLRRWRDGDAFSQTPWNTTSPIPPLNSVLARDFPAYTMAIPDVVRARIFLRHLARYEAEGRMPNLTIVQLPSDHTMGTTPGAPTPAAMVADNDLALGQIVEALTRSRFWPHMAIYVVEDDAQNGVDHVDGHRTIALVISPYARRGAVDSTFYAQQSILKSIELQLNLPSLSLFDLIANDMRASFQDTPDLRDYTAVTPTQDLFAVNPPAQALNGARREGALASMAMQWDVPDAVPSERLNRILWHEVRGWDAAYPGSRRAVFSPYAESDEDADEAP